MSKKTPEPEIQTALNVLALIEEEFPKDAQRLRRLLPALAVHFAKAGKHLSEKQLLALVYESRTTGTPLTTYFNNAALPSRKIWTYPEVARRLNKDFDKRPGIEKIIKSGNTQFFEEERGRLPMTKKILADLADTAASFGHAALSEKLLELEGNSTPVLMKIVQTCIKEKQFHVIEAMQAGQAFANIDSVQQHIHDAWEGKDYSDYRAFARLRRKYAKSAPHIGAECLTGLENWQHLPLKMRRYLQIRDILSYEADSIRERNQYAFKATMLFQTPQRLLSFLNNWGIQGTFPLTHLLKNIDPPFSSHPEWEKWGSALIQYGPDMFYPLQFAEALKAPAYNHAGKISLRQTRAQIWEKFFSGDKKHMEVAKIFFTNEISKKAYHKAIDVWGKATRFDPPLQKSVPEINIDCADFGYMGYYIRKMPYVDPRIMVMGHYSGCCEKIGDHFEETVIHALSTRESGFYAIIKSNGALCGHSWIWRGEGGQLVIDGWESEHPAIQLDFLSKATNKLAYALSESAYDDYAITDILLGVSGYEFPLQDDYYPARETATRFACQWYFEKEPNQWLVHRIKKPHRYGVYIPESSKPGFDLR